jgi:hypothetical protein
MSGDRITADRRSYYFCGQCDTKIFNRVTEEPNVPCPECGWAHKNRRKYDLPPVIPMDLAQY